MLKTDMPDHVRIAPSLALYYLAFDLTEPPLDDRLLRQSLNMSIDREQLVSIIGRGEQAAFGIIPPGVANHDGARFAWHNLPADEREAQAQELYRRAGYSDETPLAIQLTYDAGDIHEKIALTVSAMWRDVLGVDVTIRKMEWQYFLATRENRSEWQVMRFAWSGDYDDASTFTNIFRSSDPQNLSAYANPDYDQLVADASAERNGQRRAATMKAAEAMLLDDYPIAPLYFYVSKHMVIPEITGFESNALDRHPSKFLSKGLTDPQ
jgi:oligopeptide transport system substrate-binding protein